MKIPMKRWLAMMLAVILVVTGMPMEAFATSDGEDEQVENVGGAGTFDGGDEEKEWLVDESLISEYSEISFVPSNYTAQLVIAGDEYFDWSSGNWRILYTADSELGQDFFPNVVSVSADAISTEAYQMTSFWETWDAEWNDYTGRYEAKGYFKGEDSALMPNTDYYCRVVYQKWNSTVGAYEYYFLTEPMKMTTLEAVEKTAVSNVAITVENGYSDSLISWQSYSNPHNEYIAQSGFVLKYEDGTEEYVSADCQWYETYYLETTGTSVPVEVYGQIMVYTGNAEETYIRTKSCAIESLNFEDATVEVATGAVGVNGFIVDVEVTPYTVDEDLWVSVFWRKKGEETWAENKKALYAYELYDESTLWTVSNLEELTEYEYYVQIKTDYISDTVYWSNEENPITVCTKENVTYTDEQFPDDVFRNYIKEQLGLSEDEAITAEKAETITEIFISISDVTTPIKSIEGIQYLKCLKRLEMNAHDITDISMLKDMTELEEIWLSANDIVEFPDLSKLNKLYLLILENNCIDADTFAMSKYPKGEFLWSQGKTKISGDLSNQRGELRYNLPSEFYMAGDKSPFVIELKNFKSLYRQYTLTVDTGEKVVTGNGRAGDVFYIEDMGLSVGEYTARVTIEDQFGVTILDIPEVQFSVVPDECPIEPYYMEPNATTAQMTVDINEEVVKEDIQSVCLVNEESEIVETVDLQDVNVIQKYSETRYNKIIELPYFSDMSAILRNYSQVSVSANLTRYLDEGNYTLVISTQDKVYEFTEVLRVTSMPVLTDISLKQKFDSVGEYIYVNVTGINVNPEKIRPVFYKENTQITEYVSSQKTSTGFLYKLKKLDKETYWKYYDSYLIEMEADEGYSFENQISKKRLNVTTDYFNLASLVLFDYYNYSKDVYEVFFGSTVEETGTIKVKLYDESINNTLVATATGVIENNKLELQFKDENGNDFIPTDAYRMEFYDSNNLFWFWQYSTYRSYNYGHPDLYSDLLVIEKSPMYYESGVTEIPIECAILKSEVGTETEIVAELLDSYNNPIGENATLSLSTETEEDADLYVRAMGTWSNDIGLETGMYRIRFWAGDKAINSLMLRVYDNEHFYQQYQFANWVGDNLEVTVRSEQFMGNYFHLYQDQLDEEGNVQNAEQIWNDNFNVEIYDRLGNEMTEWEISSVEYSGQDICLSIENLPTDYAGFYVRVTHKDYGEGILITGGKCYSNYSGNAYGMYHSLQKGSLNFTLGGRDDAGVIGVHMDAGIEYPINVSFYEPYDTDVIHSFEITQRPVDGEYYYTEEDLSGVPKDGVYYAVATDANGNAGYIYGYFGVSNFKVTKYPENSGTSDGDDTGNTGKLGDNVQWSYDVETNVMTVTGEGDIYDYEYYAVETGNGVATTSPMNDFRNVKEMVLNLGEGITKIGDFAFYGLSYLEGDLTIPEGVTEIGQYAFADGHYNGKVGGTLTIPSTTKTIGENAFSCCTGYDELIISDGVETIAARAFMMCQGLNGTRIKLPNSIKEIGIGAFADWEGNLAVTFECSRDSYAEQWALENGFNAVYPDGEQLQPGTDDGNDETGTGDGADTPTVPGTEDGDDETGTKDGDDNDGDDEEGDVVDTIINIDEIPNQTYTGSAIKPLPNVYDGTKLLTLNKDYTATYKNNKNVTSDSQKASVVIKGKGNYAGTYEVFFNIVAKNINPNNEPGENLYSALKKGNKLVAIKPTVMSEVGGKQKKLSAKDYKLEYVVVDKDGNTSTWKAGDLYESTSKYSVVITGKGNYAGTISYPVTFVADKNKLMSNAKITIAPKKIAYAEYVTGSRPSIEVKVGKESIEGKYTVEWPDEVAAGKVTVTVTGDGVNMFGSKTTTFTITGKDIKKEVVLSGLVEKVNYTGAAQKPPFTLADEDYVLRENVDFTVTYTKNIKPGTAKLTIKGIGAYEGKLTKTFKIEKVKLEDGNVSVAESAEYTKTGAKAKVTVTVSDKVLTEGIDYKLTYKNNKKVGEATVMITGKGGYTGKTSKFSYQVMTNDFDDIVVDAVAIVDGKSLKTIKTTVTDNGKKLSKKEYTVSYKLNGEPVADVTKKVTAKDEVTVIVTANKGTNYVAGAVLEDSFIVGKASIAKATVKIAPQTYTGKKIELEEGDFTKIRVAGKDLILGTDYVIVGYDNNIDKGNNAKVIIEGINDYCGTKTVKFKISTKLLK